MIKFNAVVAIDPQVLRDRSIKESTAIFAKEGPRRGRTFEEVLVDNLYGQASEVYLMQHCGYLDDTRDYKDLYEPVRFGGKPIEVKTTGGSYTVPYVLKRANEIKNDPKQDFKGFPDRLYVFIGDRQSYDYHLEGIYDYNGIQFVKNMVQYNIVTEEFS